MAPPVYQYSALGPKQVRMFTLNPASLDTEPIRGTLRAIDLEEEEYDTVSYVWGDPSFVFSIYIDGCPLNITKNLHDALRHIRRRNAPRSLWIDAICINQSDSQEKSHQVAFMQSIFAHSRTVIVWLGLDSEGLQPLWALQESEMASPVEDQAYFTAIISLASKPWFSRVWTYQEFCHAPTATFRCGSHYLSPNALESAIDKLKASRDLKSASSHQYRVLLRSVTDLFQLRKRRKSQSLEELITSFPFLDSSDPRDTVYAWLGLAKDGEEIKPNYEKSVIEVYNDFVKHSINQSKSLDILFKPWARREKFEGQLPSWCPDWHPYQIDSSHESALTILNKTSVFDRSADIIHYNAHGRIALPDGWGLHVTSGLHVKGIVADEIVTVAEPATNGGIPASWITMGLKDLDGNPQSFWRTLVAGRDELGRPPSEDFDRSMTDILRTTKMIGSNLDMSLGAENDTSYRELIIERIRTVTWNRSFIRSKGGHFGLVPAETKPGDLITVLYGCSVPVVLRRSIRGQFYLIGECYIDGIMEGEAVSRHHVDGWFTISPTRIAEAVPTIPMGRSLQWHPYFGRQYSSTGKQVGTPEFRPLLGPSSTDAHYPTVWRQVRLRWSCECGHQGQDVYIELRSGSIEMMATKLRGEGVNVTLEELGLADPLALMLGNLVFRLRIQCANIWNSLKRTLYRGISRTNSVSNSSITRNTGKSPRSTLPSSSQSSPLPLVSVRNSQAGIQNSKDFILVCSKDDKWLTTWKDLEVSKILSDQELFNILRREYYFRKGRLKRLLSLKALCSIVFVKFALREQHEADCIQPDQLPPLSEQHYDFHERIPGHIPPIGSDFLMHRFSDPCKCRNNTLCLKQFPKRVGQAPVLGQAPDMFTGWGIYLKDGWSGEKLCIWSFGLFVFSLIFGIVWSTTHKAAIQDAFAIASYILGALASGLGSFQVMLNLI